MSLHRCHDHSDSLSSQRSLKIIACTVESSLPVTQTAGKQACLLIEESNEMYCLLGVARASSVAGLITSLAQQQFYTQIVPVVN